MANVLFKKGSYSEYKALATKDSGTLYFCEDTLQIFLGDAAYTQLIRQGSGAPTMDAPADSLYIDTAAFELYMHNGTSWEKKASLISSVEATGEGNVVTGFTFANGKLTLTKEMSVYTQEETRELIESMQTEAGAHSHTNKDELDLVKEGDVAKWDAAAAKAHEHANAEELAKIADGDKAKWDAEIGAKQAAADALAEAQKKISGVKEGEKVISVDGTELSTTLTLTYVENEKKIKLLGVGDAVVAELDATAFIKDGMLAGATYDEAADKLILSFNTDAGKENIEVPLSDLVYTAGNGIDITDNKISVVIDPATEDFLTLGVNGVKLSGVQTAIDTAKQAAIDAAGSAADQKITDLALGTMSKKSADDYDTSAQVDEKIAASALTWGPIAQ